MKNIELFIIAVIAVFAFVGCCHTHHRKVLVIKDPNPCPRPQKQQKHEAVVIEKYYYEDRWFRSKSKKRR